MGRGDHTIEALQKKHEQKRVELLHLQRAREYAIGHKLGAKATVSTGLFPPEITYNKLHVALQGKNKRLEGARADYDVLTTNEKEQLAKWVASSARGKDPATDQEISDKVIQMLKARRLDNKRRRHSSACVPLTHHENRLVTEAGAHVSHTFLTNFAADYPELQKKKERNADASRTKKQNEGVVEKHFNGEFGIVASLEYHGFMDAETKRIGDPRRCWWYDEMPQVVDADNQGPRKTAWGIKGETLERSGSVNRETMSVGLNFNLAGFLAGPQFNVGRETFTCDLADVLKVPPQAKRFDSSIYTLDMKSTKAHMSKTENGIQTQASFIKYLKSFVKEVEAYSAAEVQHGRPPIKFPIWLGTDNHSSRFSPEVLKACSPREQCDIGVRLFFEEAKTSQFLQPPDQITKLCHGAYVRGKKQYQALHKKVYGEEANLGFVEFLEIWGGCADLGYEGAWFSWIDSQTLLGAWRKCGWLSDRLAPELIDRSTFIDNVATPTTLPRAAQQHDEPLPLISYDEALQVPEALQQDPLAAAQAQIQQLQQYIAQLHRPIDYVAAGILEPKVKHAKPRKRDKTRIDESEGGDADLRDLATHASDKQNAREEAARKVEQNKKQRVEAKEEAERQSKEKLAAFQLCQGACQCSTTPCPWVGMKHCATCGDIKANECRKAKCVQARQPLMLTHATPTAVEAA